MICPKCYSSNVERRGSREKDGESYQRFKCLNCDKWGTTRVRYEVEPTFIRTVDELDNITKKDRYIITSAQNNTPLDRKFWEAIKQWAQHYNAQIIVIPLLYRNPTAPGELTSKDAWWPPEVVPYLVENEVRLFKGIRVMGHVKINATAVSPLTGLETLSQDESGVFGHPQIQMQTVATPQRKLPKILHTTGSVSQRNYSQSKAGVKGEFHHSLGAVIVELDRKHTLYHIRSVVGDRQSEFYDIDKRWHSKGYAQVKAEALVVGDEHVMFNCDDVKAATFTDPDSIVNVTSPRLIVRHDVIDSYSISHHHRQKPSIKYKKNLHQMQSLEDELCETATHIELTTPKNSMSVIVPSNHHNHIVRWLEEVDWRTEPWNARLYHKLWSAWLDHIEAGKDFHPFTWWMKENCGTDVLYLNDDYPFIVKGIYLSYHGDHGSDGSKGNIKGFARIGVKTVTAHTHSPGIEKGAYRVGTSSELKLEYTNGPSSWLNTHCLIHANGKRQLINIIDGRWRLC